MAYTLVHLHTHCSLDVSYRFVPNDHSWRNNALIINLIVKSSVEQGPGEEEEAKEENNMKAKVEEEEQYKIVNAEEFCTRQNVNPVPEQWNSRRQSPRR